MESYDELVSVIVPAYNHENFIEECIKSIINQSYKNIELIILNDGSKDKTVDIIKSYENKCKDRFTRFIFIDKENEGICKTLNKGIKESFGEYICLLASDDSMSKNCISSLVNFMNENNYIERLVSNFYIYYYDINNKQIYYKEDPKWVERLCLGKENLFLENLLQNQITVFGMYRKSVFRKVGLFDENLIIEDWDMNLRIIHNDIKLGYISEPLFFYRKHSDSLSTGIDNYEIMLQGYLQILKKVENDRQINFNKKKLVIAKAKSDKYIYIAFRIRKVNKKAYAGYIIKAIKKYPLNVIKVLKFLFIVLLKIY